MTETNFQANPAQSGELPAGVDIRSLDKFLEWRASEGPKIAESEKRMTSDAMRRAAGETPIERGLHEFLDFDAQRIATEGVLTLGPVLFGAALYKASPAEIRAGLAAASGVGIVVGFGTEAAVHTVAKAEVGPPRLVDLAKILAASHVGLRVAEISALAGIGMAAVAMGEKIIQSIHPVVQAVQPPGQVTDWKQAHDNWMRAEHPEPAQTNPQPGGEGIHHGGAGTGTGTGTGTTGGETGEYPDQGQGAGWEWGSPDEVAAAQAAGDAARATAEAAKEALTQGPVVSELMPQMAKGTAHEVIYQWLGDIPSHRMEITNAIVRSLRAAGVDVRTLHQSAIVEMAKTLGHTFATADEASKAMGVPYNEGGLWATRTIAGANSMAARAYEVANLPPKAYLEAASQLFQWVLKPVLNPILAR